MGGERTWRTFDLPAGKKLVRWGKHNQDREYAFRALRDLVKRPKCS